MSSNASPASEKIGNVARASSGLVKDIFFALKDLAILSIVFLSLLFGLFLLYIFSTATLKYGSQVVSTLEYAIRCEIYPNGAQFIPFFKTLNEVYSITTCWTNSVGFLSRLLSTKFLVGELITCTLDGQAKTFLNVIEDVSNIAIELFLKTVTWIFINPFTHTYPVYPIVVKITPLMATLRQVLNCLCNILMPLWKFITIIFQDNNLFCFLHQSTNGLLQLLQISITTAINVTLDILANLFTGSILEILNFIWNLQTEIYPQFTSSFDRICYSFQALGEYINNIFKNFICIIISEVDVGTRTDAAVEARFLQCFFIDATAVNPACIIGTLLTLPVRLVQVAFQLSLGIFRVFTPTDNFRWAIWNPNIFWDSIRNPLVLYPAPFSTSDPFIDADSVSTIEIPVLPQNITITECNETTIISNTTVICQECQLIGNISLQTCLCQTIMLPIDNLIYPVTGVRIFVPLFCDTLFAAVRVAVAAAKLVLDITRTIDIVPAPEILNVLADRRTYDRLLNEIMGPPEQLAGLLYFPNSLVLAFAPNNPDLVAIVSIITYPSKGVLEIGRLLIYIVQAAFADIRLAIPAFGLTNPFIRGIYLTNYLCIYPNGGQNCANLEDAFQWFRIPRNSSLFFQNQVPIISIPINTTIGAYQQGFLESFCDILNLNFIQSFIISGQIPGLAGFDIPDICCTFYNAGRAIFGLVEFILYLILSILQTVFELTVDGDPYNRIFILDYLACLTTNSSGSCSSINSILNDIDSIVGCGCLTITETIAIPSIKAAISDMRPLDCLCNSFTYLTSIVGDSLVIVRNAAQTVVGVFDCINVTSGNFDTSPACQVILPGLTIDLFNRIGLVVDNIGLLLQNLACLISTVFYFDCINARPVVPCLLIDFNVCVLQSGCSTYFPNETIGNNLPTQQQLNNCFDQCGNNLCTTCFNTMLIRFNSSNITVFIGCPYPCAVPGHCRPSDKIPLFIGSVYNVLGNLISLILSWITDVIVFAVEQSTGTPGTLNPNFPIYFTSYVNATLSALGQSIFGDTIHTWGFIQYFGDLLSCLIGPPNCGVQYENTGPNSHFSGAPCLGNLFVVLGNLFGGLYTAIQNIIIALSGIIEDILTGNFNNLRFHIKNLFLAIFSLIGLLIDDIEAIINLIIGFIASALEFLFTFGAQSGGSTYNIIFDVLKALFTPIILVLQGLKDILVFFKIIPSKRFIWGDTNLFSDQNDWYFFVQNRNKSPNDSFNKIVEEFTSKIGENYLKRNFMSDMNQSDYSLQFQKLYNLTDEEMVIITNPSLILPIMSNDTYCYKVINSLKTTPFNSMGLFDELIFKTCYTLVLIPILNNANTNNSNIFLPLDITYNVDTISSTMEDLKKSLDLYNNWNSPMTHMYSVLYVNQNSDNKNNNNNNMNNMATKKKRDIDDKGMQNYNLINTTEYSNFDNFITSQGLINDAFVSSYLKTLDSPLKSVVDKKISPLLNYISNFSDYIKDNNITDLTQTPPNKYSWYLNFSEIISKIENLNIKTSAQNDNNNNNNNNNNKKRNLDFKKISPLIYKFRAIPKRSFRKFKNFIKNEESKEDEEKRVKNNRFIIEKIFKENDHIIKNMINTKNTHEKKKVSMNEILELTKDFGKKTIPELIKHWWPKGRKLKDNKNELNTEKNGQHENKKRFTIPGAEKFEKNLVQFAFENVYLDRFFLIIDSIRVIFKHRINTITNITMQRLVDNGTDYIKKRAINSADFLIDLENKQIEKVQQKRRPSLPERIVHFHSQLKGIRKVGEYIPDLPDRIVKVHKEIRAAEEEENRLKRSLVTINCSCDCKVIQDFVQEFVDICTYCYEKQFLGIKDPLNLTIYKGPLIILVPINSSVNTPFPENIINDLFGIDLSATIIAFFENLNVDRNSGPIGFIYLIRRLPIPFISLSCGRVNTTCQLGMGLGYGFLLSVTIVFVLCFALYLVSPQVGGLVNSIIIGIIFGTVWFFFVVLLLNFSWGLQANCLTQPEGSLITYLVPFLGNIPLLPECASEEVYEFITTYIINTCPLNSFGLGLKNLVVPSNSSICPSCPNKLNLQSCYDYGIQSPLTIFGMFLLRYIPIVGQILQNSCLVRGSCFGFLIGSSSTALTTDGPLGVLFSGFNHTAFANGSDPILEECFYFNIISVGVGIILFLIFIIILFYFLIILIDIIILLFAVGGVFTPETDPNDSYYEEKSRKMFG